MANYSPKSFRTSKNGDNYTFDFGNVHYGECSTAAITQTKVVSIPEIDELSAGLCVRVKFINEQAYDGQPRLQINSLDIKNIARKGSTAAGLGEWGAGKVIDMVYDGTNFVIVGGIAKSDIDFALQTTNSTGRFYREDGSWSVPPGAKPIAVNLDPVVGNGGPYSHTTSNTDTTKITSDMKPISIECDNPDIFESAIEIVVNGTGENGSVTLNCSKVTNGGRSNVTVTVMPSVAAETGIPDQVTSAEFDILATRIANLENIGGHYHLAIPVNAWSDNAPYTYTWTNNKVTNRCRVEVGFASDNIDNTTLYLNFDKIDGGGGVVFSTPIKPQNEIRIVVHIINAQSYLEVNYN